MKICVDIITKTDTYEKIEALCKKTQNRKWNFESNVTWNAKRNIRKSVGISYKKNKAQLLYVSHKKISIKNESQTTLSYKKPDCNSFRIFKIMYWNRQTFHLSI